MTWKGPDGPPGTVYWYRLGLSVLTTHRLKNSKDMFVVCLALILVFISLAYFRRKTNPLPPGPTRLPILGSVPFLTTRRGLFDWALDISVTRHRLATVGFGPKKLFVINDFDLAKELFNKEEFSGRSPQPFSLAHKFFHGKAQGIVNTEGKQ